MTSQQAIWQQLESLVANSADLQIKDLFQDNERAATFSLNVAELHYDYSKQRVTPEILSRLIALADATGVQARAQSMAHGAMVNPTEQRAALHMGLRNPDPALPADFIEHVGAERKRLELISDQIRSAEWRGVTGKPMTDIINIGIGGSDLGPRMATSALREFHDGPKVHFISNVDGAEIGTLLPTLNAESTLVVISSKSFTTQETMLNADTALRWLAQALNHDAPQSTPHCLAITSNIERAKEFGIPEQQMLTFTDTIGGRYSTWSSIGFALCVAIGFDRFSQFLAGGALMDEHFLNAPATQNMPIIMGMLGIWNQNFLGAASYAVVPYCQRLGEFVDHLQQLDMESNGKSATLDGNFAAGNTGPIVWGQTGTNGQHAFFQLFHQGTHFIPVEFIAAIKDGLSHAEHHRILLANLIAQSEALMTGQSSQDPHRHYEGNRPSSVLLIDELNPKTLGMLLALYEHRIFVQACVWNINPFDQWGVELGKKLAESILDGGGEHDPSTLALLQRAGLAD